MYEKILAAKKNMEAKEAKKRKLKDSNKPLYEYDSDEDIDGGTWEHKKRKEEMEKTIRKFLCESDIQIFAKLSDLHSQLNVSTSSLV
jgi:hypothetical protein